MKNIVLLPLTGAFADNKDIARELREKELMPTLAQGESVVIDFEGLTGATQSFIHALISDSFRVYGSIVLERIEFKSCNTSIVEIIKTVSAYLQVAL